MAVRMCRNLFAPHLNIQLYYIYILHCDYVYELWTPRNETPNSSIFVCTWYFLFAFCHHEFVWEIYRKIEHTHTCVWVGIVPQMGRPKAAEVCLLVAGVNLSDILTDPHVATYLTLVIGVSSTMWSLLSMATICIYISIWEIVSKVIESWCCWVVLCFGRHSYCCHVPQTMSGNVQSYS